MSNGIPDAAVKPRSPEVEDRGGLVARGDRDVAGATVPPGVTLVAADTASYSLQVGTGEATRHLAAPAALRRRAPVPRLWPSRPGGCRRAPCRGRRGRRGT